MRPLEGIRVLEFGNFLAGPFCGMLLADMGADVIKVEPPRGDMGRAMPPIENGESISFAAVNRNKRSIVLDLKRPEAKEILLKLAAGADVVLENYRPGALERMGVGAEQVRAVNPKIVYVSVSGFGQSGPYRERAAVNLIIEAASGALSVTGEPGKMPMRPGLQTADLFGAMFATYAVLSGLIGVARQGEGRVIDLSLVEASIAAAAWETAGYLATGEVPRALGNRHRLNAPYQLFETRDKHYVAIGTPNDQLFARLLKALGLEGHQADPRFASYAKRKANEDAVIALIEAAVKTRDAADVESLLVATGVPCGRVNDYEQVFKDPQVVSRNMVVEVEHPRLGRMRTTRNPLLFDRDGPAVTQAAPLLGEHSAAILAQLGFSADEITRLAHAGVTRLGTPSEDSDAQDAAE